MHNIRSKMIKVVIASVIAVFAVVYILICGFSVGVIAADANAKTQLIANYGGRVPHPDEEDKSMERTFNPFETFTLNEESQFTTRFFIVYLDQTLELQGASLDYIASVTEEKARVMSHEAVLQGRETGFVQDYRYRIINDETGKYIIFLNCSTELAQSYKFLVTLGLLSVVMIFLISLVFILASKRAIRPFEENAKRQRQFITDAGHELKTPLAIISANAELVAYKSPESKEWITNIKKEIGNLNGLIAQLLFLSKSQEVDNEIDIEEIDLSATVRNKIVQFTDVLASRNITLDDTQLPQQTKMMANFDGMERLISILFDNSSKYTKDNGKIVVSIKKIPRYYEFILANTDSNDGPIDCERLFDRFYRSDKSRNSETGGHGIGLSIAKRICLQHKGQITANQKDGMMVFTAYIPSNLKPTFKSSENEK